MTIYEVPLKLFSRRWWLTTLVVIAGVVVLVQLGFWQLRRMEERKQYNILVAERWRSKPFDIVHNTVPSDLSTLEYRRVLAEGEFDYANQVLLKGQDRNGATGVVVVTPLVVEDGRAVLVARGWIPYNQSSPEFWPQFEEPAGQPVLGLIQESQMLPNGNPPTPPDSPQVEWFNINIDAIQPQMPYTLLPFFVLQLPEPDRPYDALPFREEPPPLDEGSHFGYAIQWFMFALILGVGYLFFIRTQELRAQRIAGTLPAGDERTEFPVEPDMGGLPPRQGHV